MRARLAATIDLSDCERLTLKDALRGRHDVARARLLDGGQPAPRRPMLWPCPLDEASAFHSGEDAAPSVDLYAVRRAVVGGGGSQALKAGAYVHGASAYPGYVKAYIEDDLTPQCWAFDPRRLKTLRVKQAFALLHFNLMWGHWLTEAFPKLFAIHALAARGVRAPIVIPSNAPVYVPDIIQDVLPGQEVIVYDPATHKVAVDQLILPPMLQSFYIFHPWFGEMLDAYVAEVGRRASSTPRIFVSRAGVKNDWNYREMTNEPEIEAVASDEGFEIVRPETLAWREQVSLFAGARVVAGEFGSGLHNTLFSPRGAKIVALNWIVDVQSRIANFRDQDIGYVLPDDGRPRTYSLDRTLGRFRIDAEEFRGRLRTAVQAAG